MTWGVESHIIERFGQAGVPREKISMVRDTFTLYRPTKAPTRSSNFRGDSMARP